MSQLTCPDCNRELKIGDWPYPCKGTASHHLTPRDAQLHPSAKLMVYEDPRTGKLTVPSSTDRSMEINKRYESWGMVPKTVDTVAGIKEVEKRTGLISNALNYDTNSAREDRDLGAS